MYTFCPNCYTIFRLTPRQLAKAGGRARCGGCREVYSAVDSLFEDLPEAREALGVSRQQAEDLAATAAQDKAAAEAAAQDQAKAAAEDKIAAEAEAKAKAAAELQAKSRTHSAAEAHELPAMQVPKADWSQGPLKVPSVFSALAIVFLLLLFASQWVYFNRAVLAAEEGWRPHMEQFCKFLRCSLPMQVDLAQLELLNRDVRQHPRVKEALLVNATLSNRAGFTQPYPVLEVSFTDLGGNTVAARRFRPIEYIIDSYTIKRGMPPGEPVPVVLEIVDPGKVAASYQFGFL